MHHYGVREVEKLLRLSRSTIRSLVAAGFVAPARGPRNAWQFSFQDLIVMRTARALVTARVPPRRIMRALRQLRARLPETMPLSGLTIGAIADHVVVREGGNHWHAESGQYLLSFEGDPSRGSLRVIERPQRETGAAADMTPAPDDWYAQGVELEQTNVESAVLAYDRAIAAEPDRVDARINLGRLLHELSRIAQAEQVYREAIALRPDEPLLHFNLGVLLDDTDRKTEAVAAYQTALKGDPQLADCHYNLALLYEELGESRRAIRHMSQYRRLVGINK